MTKTKNINTHFAFFFTLGVWILYVVYIYSNSLCSIAHVAGGCSVGLCSYIALVRLLKEIRHVKYINIVGNWKIVAIIIIIIVIISTSVCSENEKNYKAFCKGRYQYGLDEIFSHPSQNDWHNGKAVSFYETAHVQLLTSIDYISVCAFIYSALHCTHVNIYKYEVGPQNNHWAHTPFLSLFFIWLMKVKSLGASKIIV